MHSVLLSGQFTSEPVVFQSIVEEQPVALSAVAVLLLVIGLANIYLHRSKQSTADLLEQTQVEDIDALSDGAVAVSGVAQPATETLDRPTKDGECLAFERQTRTKREKKGNSSDGDGDSEVRFDTTTATSSESTAFYVEDDTGTALITDTEQPALYLEPTGSVTEVPDDLDEKRQAQMHRDTYSLVVERKHSYFELIPGDEVFVFGQANRGAINDGGQEAVGVETDVQITAHDETGDFIVTTFDREWLLEEYTSSVQLLIGLALTGVSLAFLAFIWLV